MADAYYQEPRYDPLDAGYSGTQAYDPADWDWVWFGDAAAINDGTQVLAHTREDVNEEARMRHQYTWSTQHSIEQSNGSTALARDLYWSLAQPDPELHDVPLREGYALHQQVLAALWGTDGFRGLHNVSWGDEYLAALATQGTWATLKESIDQETWDAMERASRLEDALLHEEEQAAEAQAMADDPRLSPAQRAWMQKVQEAIRARIAELAADADRTPEKLTLEQMEELAARIGSGVGNVANRVAEESEFLGQLGMMPNAAGRQNGLQWGRGASYAEKLAVAQRLQKSKHLQTIMDSAGRLIPIALQVQATRTDQVEEEIQDLVEGRDLVKVDPGDMALLGSRNPLLRKLFRLKFAQATLGEYVLDGRDTEGRGPIIVCVDNSGSMEGDKEVWSKAVLLAMLRIAQQQQRDVVVIHFDESVQRTDEFPYGKLEAQRLLDTLEHFSDGGTNFDAWMKKSMDYANKSRYNRADVIVVTDGYGTVTAKVIEKWQATRVEKEMRAYCVLIGSQSDLESDNNTVAALVDGMAATEPVTERDNAALAMIFGVGH